MVRTRFAPAPTGYLHIGNIRTALFNFLFARRKKGGFLLRIEDTDPLRASAEYERAILDDLRFLGLTWDGEPVRQSERKELYLNHARRLLESGNAYRCYCSKERLEKLRRSQLARGLPPVYDRRCLKEPPTDKKDHVVRFRMPHRRITFTDGVYGRLEFNGADIGDFIIVDSGGRATYNLTCVVDDATMGITHIIRGEDHLSNTPRQIAIAQALGFKVPEYIHLPLVTGPDRKPLSKRHTGVSIKELRKEGYLPIAILNCAARLGWHIEGLLTLEEMTESFSVEKLSRSPSIFDTTTLKRLNKTAIEMASAEELLKYLEGLEGFPEESLAPVIDAVKGNAETLKELKGLVTSIVERPLLDERLKGLVSGSKAVLEEALCLLEGAKELDENIFNTIIEELKKGGRKTKEVFMPLRVALTGTTRGIELTRVATLLGREEAIQRIKKALEEVK